MTSSHVTGPGSRLQSFIQGHFASKAEEGPALGWGRGHKAIGRPLKRGGAWHVRLRGATSTSSPQGLLGHRSVALMRHFGEAATQSHGFRGEVVAGED